MAKRIFTTEQESAINTRDKTLLVSAAAGSGKTATLTERIIRSLLDEKDPLDISRMLIVTFTNAAVKELRERISAALKEKLNEQRENEHLKKQIYMLPGARICTIDSFCNEILKNNAERLGISPTYRIADPIEARLLSHSVLSALIEAVYNAEAPSAPTPEEFEELSSSLVGVKADSALEEHLLLLYERTASLPEGVEIYKAFSEDFAEASSIPLSKNKFTLYGISAVKNMAKHYTGAYSRIKEALDPTNENEAKYIEILEEDKAFLSSIIHADSYTDIKDLLDIHKFKSMPQVRTEKSRLMLDFIEVRENLKFELKEKHRQRYFSYSESEWKNHFLELSGAMDILYRFLREFDALFFEEKRRRAMLEHSDIERLAYRSLYDTDGKPSEFAMSQRELFSAVYVDEYQDVNALQGSIFRAVAKENNRFMVGDIKQSIYGFRSAKPAIFAEMKRAYPPLSSAKDSNFASVFMSKNFRCDKGIVDFVNGVFDVMFMLAKDSIEYVPSDRLEFGKIYEPTDALLCRTPQVCLFDRSSSMLFDEDCADDETPEAEKPSDMPPLWVAKKIRELISGESLNNGSPISPSDIAIILRKDAGRSKVYRDALEKHGIPSRVPDDRDFFFNAEVQLALCLLNSINNPKRDIYLAGLMCSPLYGFTADELYLIRHSVKGQDSLWQSLNVYSDSEDFQKGKRFIEEIRHYRAISEGMPVDALILRLYKETGIMTLAAHEGKKENLLLLYNYARKFEASSFEGLYNFINYVNTIIESGAQFSAKNESGEENAVTITTIHKSKGLEYPIVFIADAGSSLVSARDRQTRVPYAEDFGAAMRLRMKGGLALVESPVYNIVMDKMCERSVEEELRVYYVALTRARERLYITGVVRADSLEEYMDKTRVTALYTSPYTLKQMKTFVDMMLLSGAKFELVSCSDMPEDTNGKKIAAPQPCKKIATEAKDITEYTEKLRAELNKRFSYEYPDTKMTELPEKMSISKLYPTVLDGTEEGTAELSLEKTQEPEYEKGILPRFIHTTAADESAKKGIATHLVLQFCDLKNLAQRGVSDELVRLSEKKFISDKDMKLIRKNELELFLRSDLFSEMISAKNLYREFRFNVTLPAALFTSDNERKIAYKDKKILLQGVIDCLIEDSDGELHLIDYKTDRLTKEELSSKTLAAKVLNEKHALQLTYYKRAVEEIFSKTPKSVRIYSLPLGDTVDVKLLF